MPQPSAHPCRPGQKTPQHIATPGATKIKFIGHSGSISLLALPRDPGWGEDGSRCLVQGGGDLVDVVQADHGEDEATPRRQKGHGTGARQPGTPLAHGSGRGGSPARAEETPSPAVKPLPGGDADSVNEARCKESQQEAEKSWEGKRGQRAGGQKW